MRTEHATAGKAFNRRASDVERTAEQIKTAFLRRNSREDTPYCWKAITTALVSKMSDNAFRVFVARLVYADKDGRNSYPAQETLAKLLGRSEPTIRRADKEIFTAKFATQERRRKTSAVVHLIDISAVNRIIAEMIGDNQDRSDLNGQEILDRADLHGLPNQDRSNLQIKTDQICTPTYYPDLFVEEERSVCARETSNDFGFQEKAVQIAKSLEASLVLTAETSQQFQQIANAWGIQPGQPNLDSASLKNIEDFIVGAIRTHDGEDANLLRAAIQDVIIGMAAKVTAGEVVKAGWGAAVKYFTTALRGTIQRMKLDAAKVSIELSGLREREGIKADTERRAGAMKTDALGRAITIGEVGREKRSTGSQQQEKSPDRFDSGRPVITVHGCIIGGDDANDLLAAVPGGNRDMVRKVLKDATGKLATKFGGDSDGFKKAQLKKITDWCEQELRREVAYATHGPPETVCGGPVAILDSTNLKNDYVAVSQTFVEALRAEHPFAFGETVYWAEYNGNDNGYREPVQCGERAMAAVFADISQKFVRLTVNKCEGDLVCDWSKYGLSSQQEIETAFRDAVASVDGWAQRALAENREFEAQRDQTSGFTRSGDKPVMTPEFKREIVDLWGDITASDSHIEQWCSEAAKQLAQYGDDWRPHQAREEFERQFARKVGCRTDKGTEYAHVAW